MKRERRKASPWKNPSWPYPLHVLHHKGLRLTSFTAQQNRMNGWFTPSTLPHPHFILKVKSAPREHMCKVSLLVPPPSNGDDGTQSRWRGSFLDQISWGCLREVLKWHNKPVRSGRRGYSTRAGKEGWSRHNVGGMNEPQCQSELVI